MATAKDKDRQELILKAINALDEQDKMSISQEGQYKSMHYHGMSPSMHASLLMGENVIVLRPLCFMLFLMSVNRFDRCLCWNQLR